MRWTRLLMVLAWSGACVVDGGQQETDGTSGDASTSEDTDDTGAYSGRCDFVPTVLPSLQDVGRVGQSGAELVAMTEGVYTGRISWLSSVVSHVNAGRNSPMVLELSYEGGEIRDVDSILVEPCQHDGPCPCEDRLEVDMRLRISSEDGGMQEDLLVAVQSSPAAAYFDSPFPHVHHVLDPDATPGGLETSHFELDEAWTLRDLVLDVDFREGAATGSILVSIEMLGGIGAGPVVGIAGIREVTDAACGAIVGSACAEVGCAATSAREVTGDGSACGCAASQTICVATPGGAAATELWARPDPHDDTYYDVHALEEVVEPLAHPWVPCSELPEVPQCACFGGVPACP